MSRAKSLKIIHLLINLNTNQKAQEVFVLEVFSYQSLEYTMSQETAPMGTYTVHRHLCDELIQLERIFLKISSKQKIQLVFAVQKKKIL